MELNYYRNRRTVADGNMIRVTNYYNNIKCLKWRGATHEKRLIVYIKGEVGKFAM